MTVRASSTLLIYLDFQIVYNQLQNIDYKHKIQVALGVLYLVVVLSLILYFELKFVSSHFIFM